MLHVKILLFVCNIFSYQYFITSLLLFQCLKLCKAKSFINIKRTIFRIFFTDNKHSKKKN